MSMSEEEAIELLEEMKNNCLTKREYKDEKAEKKAKAIETLIEALDEYKIACNCGKQNTDTLRETIRILQKENRQKDKIIELMAIFIANLDIDEDICKYQIENFCKEEACEVSVNVCIKCIKQYFEKKVDGNDINVGSIEERENKQHENRN